MCGEPRNASRKTSKQDLRAWLEALRAAGEVQEISGAEREQEIGGIVDLYMRKMGNPAVLFDDVPGYPRGHRILANILTSVRRINLTLGLPIDGSRGRARLLLAQIHEGGEEHPAGHGQDRPAHGERLHRQGHRHPENPDAALARARRRLLHRHRLHGDHEGSRHRLDQLRRLPGAVARAERRDGDVLEGQARRPDQAPLPRARRAVPDRGRGRHASGAVHGGGARDSLRQERIRRRRRSDRRAGRGDQGAAHRPADPGACRDRLRRLRASRRPDRRGPARRMDRLLRRRQQEGAGDPHRDLHAPQRSDPARRDPGRAAGRRLRSIAAPIAPARCGTSSKPPAYRR